MNPFHTPSGLDRRTFLRATTAAVAGAALPPALRAASAEGRPAPETLVQQLHGMLTDAQREAICFPFEHELRSKVDNNWHITKPELGSDFFTADQRELAKQIFLGIHSEEYAETVLNQVAHDSGEKGFGASSVALFGEPGTGRFEFVLTGRHCTRRCDGDSVEGTAFGGPIFYGHAAKGFYEKPDHPGNAYWFQAKRANEVFQALDGAQREVALVNDEGPEEQGNKTVDLTGKTRGLPGIRVGELAADQQDLVRKVMADLLAPFRKADAEEAMKYVEANGFDNLHMAFYKLNDIGEDGVWDVWQIEGPSMKWYFRGDPHVHVWVNIREKAQAPA